MEIGIITKDEIDVVRPLLVPKVADEIASGEPIVALAVTEGDNAVGALAGRAEGRDFLITSLYVAKSFRRRGAASLLMESLFPILAEEDLNAVMDFLIMDEEHESLVPFLLKMGFSDESDPDFKVFRISIKQLEESAFISRGGGNGISFSSLDEYELRKAQKMADENFVPTPECGLNGPGVEKEISMAHLTKDGITAFVAWDRSFAGKLTLAAVWAEETDPSVLLALLRASFVKIKETCKDDKEIFIQTVNESSERLVTRLFPEAESISYTMVRECRLETQAEEEESEYYEFEEFTEDEG